jgi:hypothetical protein
MLNSTILISDKIQTAPKKSRSLDWYHKNKEKVAAYKKAHYKANISIYKERAVKFGKSETRKQYLIDNKEKTRDYNKERWLKLKETKPHLKAIYNITLEKYNEMFIKQKECCLGCNQHRSLLKRDLCVDHCHVTGKIRGLLCDSCNKALGLIKDDKNILLNLITYLNNA